MCEKKNDLAQSALAGAMPAQGWRPIASAPKDGTKILLARGDRVTEGEWMAEKWPTAAEYHATGEYLGQYETGECIEARWISWDGDFDEEDPPTHWQPLPKGVSHGV